MNNIYKVTETRQAASADAVATNLLNDQSSLGTGLCLHVRAPRQFKLLSKAFILLIIAFLFPTTIKLAQATVVPPAYAFAEITVATQSLHDVTINCDMVGEPSGFIRAIVWSDLPFSGSTSAQSYIYAADYSGHTDILPLPSNSADPDVALACYEDPVFPHDLLYQVVVTYTIGTTLVVEVYDLIDVGLSTFHIKTSYTQHDEPTDICNGFPHIDMWADGSYPFITTYYAMHQFAVVYSEGSNANLRGYVNDVVSWGANDFPMPAYGGGFVSHCMKPDVACQTNSSYDQLMHIVYEDAAAGTTVGSALMTLTHNYSTPATITGPNTRRNGNIYAPRIEAINDFVLGNSSDVDWQVAYSIKNGTVPNPSTDQVWGFNLVFGFNDISGQDFGPAQFYECMSACVAAGAVINHWYYPNIGNQQYTVGFYPWDRGVITPPKNIYARAIDASTGDFFNTNTYQVNSTSGNVDFHYDYNRNMAITNCSNYGNDIMTAWYNGTDIIYKHSTPDVMAFKPSGVSNAQGTNLSLSPNPTADELHIEGIVPGTDYFVTDMAGRTVMTGKLTITQNINASNLSTGQYILRILDGKKGPQYFSFAKQ